MKAIKYFTNPLFNATLFVQLCHLNGVKAYACADKSGVILDREQFSSIRLAELPHFLYLNKEYVESEFHTRPAYADEAANLLRFG